MRREHIRHIHDRFVERLPYALCFPGRNHGPWSVKEIPINVAGSDLRSHACHVRPRSDCHRHTGVIGKWLQESGLQASGQVPPQLTITKPRPWARASDRPSTAGAATRATPASKERRFSRARSFVMVTSVVAGPRPCACGLSETIEVERHWRVSIPDGRERRELRQGPRR